MISKFTAFSLLLAVSAAGADDAVHYENVLVNGIEPGVRAAGMGGAFRAVADDYSAVHYNPAGLTQIKRFELNASLLHYRQREDATLGGVTFSPDIRATRFGNLGVVLPYPVYRGGLAFAAGITRTHLFDAVTGTDNSSSRLVHMPAGGLSRWSIACGTDLSADISAGGALNFISGGAETADEGFYPDDSTGTRMYFRDSRDLSYSGINAVFGLLVRSGRFMKLGLTVTTPTPVTEKGTNLVQDDDDPDLPSPVTDTYLLHNTLVLPYVFAGGIALYSPWALLAFDAEYTDWAQLRVNGRADTEHRETINLSGGIETMVPGTGIKLRAGYAYRPVVFDYALRVTRERQTLTFGTGFLVDELMAVDIAYTYRIWQTEDLQYSVPVSRTGTGHLVQVSGAYRF